MKVTYSHIRLIFPWMGVYFAKFVINHEKLVKDAIEKLRPKDGYKLEHSG